MRTLVLVVCALAIASCVTDRTYQERSASYMNCAADNIQISDIQKSGANSWKAICRTDGKIYRCKKEGCTEIK